MNRSLILSIPSTLFNSSNKVTKLTFPCKSFPYEAICIPVKTTSFIPLLDIFLTSLITFSKLLLLTLPLAYGIIQYVQKLLQPVFYFYNCPCFFRISRISIFQIIFLEIQICYLFYFFLLVFFNIF